MYKYISIDIYKQVYIFIYIYIYIYIQKYRFARYTTLQIYHTTILLERLPEGANELPQGHLDTKMNNVMKKKTVVDLGLEATRNVCNPNKCLNGYRYCCKHSLVT